MNSKGSDQIAQMFAVYVYMYILYTLHVAAQIHTCDSTAGSRKTPFIKPVCRSTVPVEQTTVFENFRKYYENPIKSVPISLFGMRQSN